MPNGKKKLYLVSIIQLSTKMEQMARSLVMKLLLLKKVNQLLLIAKKSQGIDIPLMDGPLK